MVRWANVGLFGGGYRRLDSMPGLLSLGKNAWSDRSFLGYELDFGVEVDPKKKSQRIDIRQDFLTQM